MSAAISAVALNREAGPQPAVARPRGRPAGGAVKKLPAALSQRSRDAKQRAAAILEVLAGGRTPTQAAQALGVSLGRYYLLQDKALATLVAACELQPRGRRGDSDGARRVASLERECERWQRECVRQQALVRAAMLREQALQAALDALAPQPMGRPPKSSGSDRQRIDALQLDNERSQRELAASKLREEISLVLPNRPRRGEKKRRGDSAC